jgi:hypothetical protein
MQRLKLFAIAAAALGTATALTAAAHPSALGQTLPGMWEISGIPGARAPLKQCVRDILALAEFEHRGKGCTMKVISDDSRSTVIEYSCGSAGFGRSDVEVITPRSLRIDTQGISNQLPFSYLLQARRVGDCAAQVSALRH